MGTNYYLMTKNKSIAHTYFEDEYKIVDAPFLGYEIHLGKTSFGWAPLMEIHPRAFSTFKQLKDFFFDHPDTFSIYDEYGEKKTWFQLEKKITEWANIAPRGCKWVKNNPKYMDLVDCELNEADILIPFRHDEYGESERKAAQKFGVRSYNNQEYTRDPDYKIDWVKGDFA